MKYKNILFYISVVSMLTAGCDSFLDIPISPQLIESKNLLSNESSIQSAVDGVYAHMRTMNPSFVNGAVSIYVGLSSDELRPTSVNPIYDPFFKNTLLSDNSYLKSSLWSPGYQNIYRCNALIDALRTNVTLAADIKNRFIGELLVSRALQYSYLTYLYGDIPLVLTSDYSVNATMGQTPHREILHQVALDLQEARELLPIENPTLTKTRPTYWAATALLARIYLYLGNYEQAIELSTTLINGPFTLHKELDGIFLINSVETIWEIAQPSPTGNTPDGGAFIPSAVDRLPPIALTESIINLFESQDLRLTRWIGKSSASSENTYYPRKYIYRQPGEIKEYMVVLRLGEQYLIRAEAYLGMGDEVKTRADLNVIRERAEASLLESTVTGEALTIALRNERQRELFSEWAHRWIDLKRWEVIDDVMKAAKPDWESYMALFPIPEDQLRYNYKLTQNPGY